MFCVVMTLTYSKKSFVGEEKLIVDCGVHFSHRVFPSPSTGMESVLQRLSSFPVSRMFDNKKIGPTYFSFSENQLCEQRKDTSIFSNLLCPSFVLFFIEKGTLFQGFFLILFYFNIIAFPTCLVFPSKVCCVFLPVV